MHNRTFRLTRQEVAHLRFQIGISSSPHGGWRTAGGAALWARSPYRGNDGRAAGYLNDRHPALQNGAERLGLQARLQGGKRLSRIDIFCWTRRSGASTMTPVL